MDGSGANRETKYSRKRRRIYTILYSKLSHSIPSPRLDDFEFKISLTEFAALGRF